MELKHCNLTKKRKLEEILVFQHKNNTFIFQKVRSMIGEALCSQTAEQRMSARLETMATGFTNTDKKKLSRTWYTLCKVYSAFAAFSFHFWERVDDGSLQYVDHFGQIRR